MPSVADDEYGQRCGVYQQGGSQRVPIQYMNVTAKVSEGFTYVTCEQMVLNTFYDPIEAVFIFDAQQASVTCLEAEMDGARIKGIVKPNKKAADEYDDAIAQGQRAVLVEKYRDEESEVFKMLLGNLASRAYVRVIFKFIVSTNSIAILEDSSLRLKLPVTKTLVNVSGKAPEESKSGKRIMFTHKSHYHALKLTTRRSSVVCDVCGVQHKSGVTTFHCADCDFDICLACSQLSHDGEEYTLKLDNKSQKCGKCASEGKEMWCSGSGKALCALCAECGTTSAVEQFRSGMHVSVELEMSHPITSATCETHPFQSILDADRRKLTLVSSDAERWGKANTVAEFSVKLEKPESPSGFISEGEINGKMHRCAVVTFYPQIQDVEDNKTEYVFVVDTSGSMSGSNIKKAINALVLMIKSIPFESYFNVVDFNSTHRLCFPSSAQVSDESLQAGVSFSERLQARGGTNLHGPLQALATTPIVREGYTRSIIVITDGDVDNKAQVIHLCRSFGIDTRVFSMGIGDGANRRLVRGIATNGGTAVFVANGGNIEEAVLTQLTVASRPALRHLTLTPKGFSPRSDIPLVDERCGRRVAFAGESLTAVVLLDSTPIGAASMTLSGIVGETPVSFSVNIDSSCVVRGEAYALLAAKQRIDEIEMKVRDESSKEEKQRLKDSGEVIAVEFGVASAFTSFIAVHEALAGQASTQAPKSVSANTSLPWDEPVIQFGIEVQNGSGNSFTPSRIVKAKPPAYCSSNGRLFERDRSRDRSRVSIEERGIMHREIVRGGSEGIEGCLSTGSPPRKRQLLRVPDYRYEIPVMHSESEFVHFYALAQPSAIPMPAIRMSADIQAPMSAVSSLSSSAPPPAAVNIVTEFAKLQSAQGYFKFTDTALSLLTRVGGVWGEKGQAIGKLPEAEQMIVLTRLVLEILETLFQDKKSEWSLYAGKARTWLKKNTASS